MNYRDATLLGEESTATAGTKTIDLDISDIISRINIKYDVTKALSYMSGHPAQGISKIELVDGSDVLFSMTGNQAQGLNIYDRQCGSMCEGCHIGANDEIAHFGIDFGRYLWDPTLAFDPNKFNNPQLKITHALTATDASATTSTLEVHADCFDEKKVAPSGFLMSKEIYTYTCGAANSYEYIDLPIDYPIRKMLIRGYYASTQPCDSITAFRIDENMEQKIPIDIGTETYYSYMIAKRWKPVYELFQAQVTTAEQVYYITPSWYWRDFNFTSKNGDAGAWQTNSYYGDKVGIDATAGGEICGSVTGYLPNSCIEVPFGNDQDINDWYNVTTKNNVRLRLKAGSNATSGTGQVVLQQARKY